MPTAERACFSSISLARCTDAESTGSALDSSTDRTKRVRLTHYGVPAELAEARPESLLSPPAPGKAINALGSGRRHDGGVLPLAKTPRSQRFQGLLTPILGPTFFPGALRVLAREHILIAAGGHPGAFAYLPAEC